MRIAAPVLSYPPALGGAQTHLRQLVRHAAEGLEYQVLTMWSENRTDWLLGSTLRAPVEPQPYLDEGRVVGRFGYPGAGRWAMVPDVLGFYAWKQAATRRLAARLGPSLDREVGEVDLVHTLRIGREHITQAALDLARRRGVPFVLTPLHHPRWGGFNDRVFHRLYRQADRVLTMTEAEVDALADLGVDRGRCSVVGHGPCVPEGALRGALRARLGLGDEPVVLFLGQFFEYKGYRQLREAAEQVWREHPETRFVFMGWLTPRARRFFEGCPDPRVHLVGAASQQHKAEALADCTLLCVPSTQESFGGVYAEAWVYGAPVIGCDIPAVREVLAGGEAGRLVPRGAPAIAEAVLSLLRDPEEAKRLGAAGRRRLDERYRWARVASKVADAYREAGAS